MRHNITKLAATYQRLPLPMQLIIITAIAVTALAGLSIKIYERYAAAQKTERKALWPHVNGGKPPHPQKINRLSGMWIYETRRYSARLQMKDRGIFQLITGRKDVMTRRNYVRGFYTVDDQTLYLRQDDRFGRPFVQGRPEIDFMPVSLREIRVHYKLQRQGRRMTWILNNSNRNIRNLKNSLGIVSGEQIQWYKAR
jgi:hypothetical protein